MHCREKERKEKRLHTFPPPPTLSQQICMLTQEWQTLTPPQSEIMKLEACCEIQNTNSLKKKKKKKC